MNLEREKYQRGRQGEVKNKEVQSPQLWEI